MGASGAWPIGFLVLVVTWEMVIPTKLWVASTFERGSRLKHFWRERQFGAWQGVPLAARRRTTPKPLGLLVGALTAEILGGFGALALDAFVGSAHLRDGFSVNVIFTGTLLRP